MATREGAVCFCMVFQGVFEDYPFHDGRRIAESYDLCAKKKKE